MSSVLPWFRLYSETVDDPKLKLLAYEDRWHFVAILCCKCQGLLDGKKPDLVRRMVAVKLGLDLRELDEVCRRLSDVGLVDRRTIQPKAWDDRQFKSDRSTDRVRQYRKRKQKQSDGDMKQGCNVSETAQDTDTDTDTEQKRGELEPLKLTSKPPPKPTIPYQEIIDAYNRLCPSLKTCRRLNDKRRKRIRQLWKTDAPSLRHWEALFEDCEARDAWAGRLPPKPPYDQPFRADFDFVTREETITRLVEDD